MKIPQSWLNELAPLPDISDFAKGMTMSGTKVEGLEFIGQNINKIVVGKILELKKHIEADKLLVAKVDIGTSIIQIVTGATNIKVNDLVPIVLDGGSIADGSLIKDSKLRGILSQGMMCSIEELGYTTKEFGCAPEDGIYIFKDDTSIKVGDNVLSLQY